MTLVSVGACYGTTKYCRAWLRNMTCSNPDCLYLHDIGSQEDSFTKDEIISAYTRYFCLTLFACTVIF
ncbi:RNA recognition [Musa troglodytarum]|uniref:RNA recognition n=1 Tax=Musa troglodytarum TaxID=320322 RepID=A0A9E7HWC4_9LILI|nr:RNA recognition [Musa troglodytarum]